MALRKRKHVDADAVVEEAWPASLAKAERELQRTLDRLLSTLPDDHRLAFVWRAAGLLATCEADAQPPAVIAPRNAGAEETIEAIRQRLRALLGPRACAPGEIFHFPSHLPAYAGYNELTVEHVDAFLCVPRHTREGTGASSGHASPRGAASASTSALA